MDRLRKQGINNDGTKLMQSTILGRANELRVHLCYQTKEYSLQEKEYLLEGQDGSLVTQLTVTSGDTIFALFNNDTISQYSVSSYS